jgi:hypothetical protein
MSDAVTTTGHVSPATDRIYALGVGIVSLFAVIYVTTWFGLLIGTHTGIPVLVISVVLLGFLNRNIEGDSACRYGYGVLAPVVALLLFGLLSCYVLDSSWDGLKYHQTAVLELMSGWNPLESPLPDQIFLNSYPKASWLVGASLAGLFDSVEAMKAQNMAFMLAAACLSFSTIRYLMPELRAWVVMLIAAAVALNPVAIYQCFTGYLDGLLGSQITCLVALGTLSTYKHRLASLSAFLLLIPYTLNLKFTAIPDVAILWMALSIILLWRRRAGDIGSVAIPALVVCVIGVLVFGANPYLRNMVDHGHIFYPIMGSSGVDIMHGNMPLGMVGKSYGFKLAAGLFAAPIAWIHGDIDFFFPLFPRLDYFRAFGFADMRVGGFGPLFGAAVLVSTVGAALLRKLSAQQVVLIFLAVTMVISCLINPESWWARYVPQLWLAIACLSLALVCSDSSISRWLGIGVAAIMIVNSLGIAAYSVRSNLYDSAYWKKSLTQLANRSDNSTYLRIDLGQHRATWARLNAYEVRYVLVPDGSSCVNAIPLLPEPKSWLSTARVCSN